MKTVAVEVFTPLARADAPRHVVPVPAEYDAAMRVVIAIACCVGFLSLVGCASRRPLVVDPPAMPLRVLGQPPATRQIPGEQVALVDGDVHFILYTPPGYVPHVPQHVRLAMHFHGAPWFAIEEHRRRGLDGPLVCFALGEGSSVYRRAFEDGDRVDRIIKLVQENLSSRFGKPVTIDSLDVSSFSAGYGAVREIVRSPRYLDMMHRVVLCDSMYAGWDPATTRPGATSQPVDEQIDVWMALAKKAEAGEVSFAFTYSQVPTPYANSAACAHAIADEMGLKFRKGAGPAATDPRFPLIERADVGSLHLWGYGGTDAAAHLTHMRHLADVWLALERVER